MTTITGQLSGKEKEVANLLLQGKSNKQIALALGVTVRTVEFHLGNIYAKIGVNSRTEAILLLTKSETAADVTQPANGLRDSTVDLHPAAVDNVPRARSPWRLSMRKMIFPFLGLFVGGLGLAFGLLKISARSTEAANMLASPSPSRPSSTHIPTPSLTPTPLPTSTATATPDVSRAQLTVDWFYIDESRAHLELSVCDLPVPDGSRPIHVVDAANIRIQRADGSQVELVERAGFGGGGGGEENPAEEKPACFPEIIDFRVVQTLPNIAPDEMFSLEIPIGGDIVLESGDTLRLPTAAFHLQQMLTYTQLLTFAMQKSTQIEDKTITFNSLELNPNSAALNLCVFDPAGEQWLPGASLIYRGAVIDSSSAGVTGVPDRGSGYEFCYRMNYAYPFHPGAGDEPQADLSILLTQLTKDQPERLPATLIAQAESELAEQGITFNYIIVDHGANIVITKKPGNITEKEALRRVSAALAEQAVAPGTILFSLMDSGPAGSKHPKPTPTVRPGSCGYRPC